MPAIEEIIKKRLASASFELAEVEAKRRTLLALINEFRLLLGQCNDSSNQGLQVATTMPHEKPYAKMTAMQTIQAVLHKSEKPMRIVEIAIDAMKGGYGGDQADPDRVVPNFSSAISRSLKDDDSPFERGEVRGMIGLREWSTNGHPTH